MQCFTHPNEIAAGVCKSCGKGVCRSCAIQVDRGLACSETCKPFAEALSRLQLTSIHNIGLATAQRFIQPLMAVIFLGMAWYLSTRFRPDPSVWFLYALGAVFALTSIMSWLRLAQRKK